MAMRWVSPQTIRWEGRLRKSILKSFIIIPLSLLLFLILIASFSSCSKPNLGNIVREHVAAVNNDDIEKNLTFFTDDSVFQPDPATKLSGKAQVRNLMEWDVANHARLSLKDLKVAGNTVITEITENNEGWRLLGIDCPFSATYEFRGRQIRRVKLEFSPESWKTFEDAFGPFAEWAKLAHPEEFQRMNEAGYSADGARLFLFLAKEWRDKIQTESVEQELIKLENEWVKAWIKSDIVFFDRIVADDFTFTSPWSGAVGKAEFLALVESGDRVFASWALADMKVRIYSNAAVVTGGNALQETYKGKDVSSQNRWTHTWVKLAGHWQCVAAHSSRIAQE
jgi:ketosteroid isomerase-like protein